ncbi:MAG TPA: lysylphosphatidylglycerol synthase transmembrane domain-containing protein [Anaerolineaceae bacterium]|nr:lysylphosphatidylglycerol synthase transmembrane domain-containing protein [Anaerolineaceae bacterium]
MADSNKPSILRRMIPGIILGFLVLVGLVLAGDVGQVTHDLASFRWEVFPIALGFTLFNYILRFFKWHYYLRLSGVSLPMRESSRLFVAGFPLAVTPGKAGEALKAVWLNQASGLPFARGVSVVLAERISDGLAVLALSALGVITTPRYWPAFALILAGLVALVVFIQIRPAALWLLGLCERVPLLRRATHGLREFYEGSFTLFRPRATLTAITLGAVSWLGEGVGFYVILTGLGLPPSQKLLAGAIFVLAFSTALGAASALPGGLGAAEASIAGMLALVIGLPAGIAASATVLIRLATLWFGVSLGLATWLFSKDLLGLKEVHEPVAEG